MEAGDFEPIFPKITINPIITNAPNYKRSNTTKTEDDWQSKINLPDKKE